VAGQLTEWRGTIDSVALWPTRLLGDFANPGSVQPLQELSYHLIFTFGNSPGSHNEIWLMVTNHTVQHSAEITQIIACSPGCYDIQVVELSQAADQRGVSAKGLGRGRRRAGHNFLTTSTDSDARPSPHRKLGYCLGCGRGHECRIDHTTFTSQPRACLHITASTADESSNVHGR